MRVLNHYYGVETKQTVITVLLQELTEDDCGICNRGECLKHYRQFIKLEKVFHKSFWATSFKGVLKILFTDLGFAVTNRNEDRDKKKDSIVNLKPSKKEKTVQRMEVAKTPLAGHLYPLSVITEPPLISNPN